MPKISVIVPVYKTEKTLERCLVSILQQTITDFEIVVVDDGSPDNAVEIAEKYRKKDSRIKIVRQKNQGLGAARNTGIKNAGGKYIACVDSDDYIASTMLEKMCKALEENDADISICQADNILYKDGEKIKSLGAYTIPGKEDVMTGEMAVTLQLNYVVPILFNSVCFKLVKKDLFLQNQIWFPEGFRYAEDTPTSVGLLLNSRKVAFVRENLYFYVRENTSLTSSYSLKKANDIYLDMKEICDYAKKVDYHGTMSNFILGMLFPMVKQIVWADIQSDDQRKQKSELLKLADSVRNGKGLKPDFTIDGIPFAQKMKIMCAYHNWTPTICKIIWKFRWIPFVKYML